MKWTYLIPALMLVMSACNTKVKDAQDTVLKREVASSKEACERGECPCATEMGTIAHGSKTTIYTKELAACDEGCGKFAQQATCSNGKLSVDLKGKYFRCTVQDCPACTLGKNLILSGESVVTYRKEVVGCRDSCEAEKQVRKCVLGNLDGSDDFKFFSCQRKTCRCNLPDETAFVSLDGSVKLFSAEQATCGNTCEDDFSQNRVCSMSTDAGGNDTFFLSGGAQYKFRACREAINCFCTLPNGLGVIAHNETKTIYNVPTVDCGESCDTKPKVTVKCDNGVFKNNANLNEIIDFTQPAHEPYKYICRVNDCVSCPVPGTSTRVLHGQTYNFAKSLSVGCAATCEFKMRTCVNGTFDGDTTYAAAACERRACKCPVPGVTGVDVPVDNNYTFFSKARAACNETCADVSVDRKCVEVLTPPSTYNYSFDGNATFSFAKCDEATNCACVLPNNLGQITHGTPVKLTSLATIPCGQSCDQVPSVDLRCENGFLVRSSDGSVVDASSPTWEYIYRCRQSGCSGCVLPGYGTIASGNTMTLFAKDKMGCQDKPELLKYEFTCENSVLLRNGTRYDPMADPNRPPTWYTSYINDCPGCPLPWGGSIGEGTTVNAFKHFGTVINGCGRGCKTAQRKCERGVLSGDASFDLKECNNKCSMEGGGAPPRTCLLRWQNTYVTPDTVVPVWSKRRVPANDSCQKYYKLTRCEMLTGNLDAPADFMYGSCAEEAP